MKLYLFMKAEYLLSCLENDEIKVILPEGCNDPFEFKPREKMGKTPHDTDGVGMICLSEECTSTTMWAHYADKHQGVCLEFSFNKAKRKIKYDTSDNEGDSQASKVAIIEVKRPYVKQFTELPRPAGKTGAPSFIPLMMKVKYSPYRAYPAEYQVLCDFQGKRVLHPRYSRLYAAKGQEWAYEKEWRLFVTLDNCKSYHDSRHFVKGLTPYISKVLLGVKCPLSCEYVRTEAKKFLKRPVSCARMEADSKLFAVREEGTKSDSEPPVWHLNLEIKDAIWQKLWKEAQAQKLPSPEALIIKLINESITPSKKTNR
ncbi:MAG: DUF2971 domain-containing protein [Akkermansia sp.]|nr:DUF2971 domain-containing protein [Akkermansia sp.]